LRVVVLQALEEEQQRMLPAPFEHAADWADVFQVAVRVGDERLSLTGVGARFELVES
jgi:hypothetical protein